MNIARIELTQSRVLPLTGSIFYLLGYWVAWILPWYSVRLPLFALVVAMSLPFLRYILNGCRPGFKALNVQENQIIGAYGHDNRYYPVKAFRPIRAFSCYLEIDLYFGKRDKQRVCIMHDMLDKSSLCRLKQIVLTSFQTKDRLN